MDEIRHQHIIRSHEEFTLSHNKLHEIDTENYILYSNLKDHLEQALEKMPSSYREVFEKSRFKGMKYREIAEQLNISERTVEVRIAKVIQFLKKELKDFLLILFLLGIR